ncbi:hypothetical protein [Huaxiibacter chinensis]|uniref:hypothetical protein n=1 Tax=Huaxiibacter chinensis TaxID=2899785 RepID=UPI003D3114D8
MIVNKKLAMNQVQPPTTGAKTRVVGQDHVEKGSPGHKHLRKADILSMEAGAALFGQSKVRTAPGDVMQKTVAHCRDKDSPSYW